MGGGPCREKEGIDYFLWNRTGAFAVYYRINVARIVYNDIAVIEVGMLKRKWPCVYGVQCFLEHSSS